MRKTMILPIFAISAIAAGCGGSSYGGDDGAQAQAAKATATAAAPAAKKEAVVQLEDTTFQPGDIQLKVGEKVRFENEDAFAHTVTATAGAKFDSGSLDQGKTFEFTADKAGKISYVCTFHPGMAGTITVS